MVLPLADPRIILSTYQRHGLAGLLAACSVLVLPHELSCGVARAAWLVVRAGWWPLSAHLGSRV
jgi:hypothetical protein